MEIINSIDNQKIKHIRKLLNDKKYRAEKGEYVAEGTRWVLDALEHKRAVDLVSGVYASESFVAKRETLPDGLVVIADSVFEKISATENTQGLLAVLKIEKYPICDGHCLLLDGIRDPGNLGTIIRTAAAAGFRGITLFDCVDAYNPKVIRSSMSALLQVSILEVNSAESFLETVKECEYTVFAADTGGENIFTNQLKSDKICLIIGSEADGIRPELLNLADQIVSIPMQNGIESLNAAVAAGILMYQLIRQA